MVKGKRCLVCGKHTVFPNGSSLVKKMKDARIYRCNNCGELYFIKNVEVSRTYRLIKVKRE